MPLQKLQFRPGIIKDVPSYTNGGGWWDGNLVRFKNGFPQPIGGWQKYTSSQFNGTCRDLISWVALSGKNYIGIGTSTKYYIEDGGILEDVTPIRKVSTGLSGPFSATNGSSTLTITDPGHGCQVGDFLTISGATGLGGNVTATVLNREYQVATIISSSRYTVVMSVTANASDSGNGGTVNISYQISTGLDTQVGGVGWGSGVWGGASAPFSTTTLGSNPIQTSTSTNTSTPYDRTTLTITHNAHGLSNGDSVIISGATSVGGVDAIFINRAFNVFNVTTNTYDIYSPTNATSSTTGGGASIVVNTYKVAGNVAWGEASTVSVAATLRLWSSDNFGQDLVYCVRNGGIYYWSPTYGSGVRGVSLDSLTADPACPTIGAFVRVSENERHVIVFGGNKYFNNDGTINSSQDPLLIKWSNQEDYTTWSPSATNTAGDLRLGSGTKIVHAVETKREILVWTDTSLYSMQYIGPPYTYGINQIAANTTTLGFNSFANVEDIVYWMGNGKFYVYDGRTSELPCPIQKHIFDNFNYSQSDKVFAAVNSQFNEVTWFYPSAESEENNLYVTYNYAERAWTYGTLARTAWIDRGTETYPIGAGVDSYLYNHEYGTDDGSTNPFSPIHAYLESSPIEIGSGDQFAFIRKIIPDVGFYDSTSTTPTVTMTLKTQNFPGSNYQNTSNSAISQTATVPIEQFTEQAFVRLRGRQVSFKISSEQVGTFWTLGTPRIEIQPDGKR